MALAEAQEIAKAQETALVDVSVAAAPRPADDALRREDEGVGSYEATADEEAVEVAAKAARRRELLKTGSDPDRFLISKWRELGGAPRPVDDALQRQLAGAPRPRSELGQRIIELSPAIGDPCLSAAVSEGAEPRVLGLGDRHVEILLAQRTLQLADDAMRRELGGLRLNELRRRARDLWHSLCLSAFVFSYGAEFVW